MTTVAEDPLDTSNSAIVTVDVLLDASRLLRPDHQASPADYHALNSLVEAAVLHNELFVPWPSTEDLDNALIAPLVAEEILIPAGIDRIQTELMDRGRWDDEILADLVWGRAVGADNGSGAAHLLEEFVRFDERIGLLHVIEMDELLLGPDLLSPAPPGTEELLDTAEKAGYTEEDITNLASTSRHLRGASKIVEELGFEIYTGLLFRPFLLSHWSAKRREARKLFDTMKDKLNLADLIAIPAWSRIEIPEMTGALLRRIEGDPERLGEELLHLREKHSGYRLWMSQYQSALQSASTPGELLRQDAKLKQSWAATLQHEIPRKSRLLHWGRRARNIASHPTPVGAAGEVFDEFIERCADSAARNWVAGLTDLWRELANAPTIRMNIGLITDAFGSEPDYEIWERTRGLSERLERLMNEERVYVAP
jgi:hypothetical protein